MAILGLLVACSVLLLVRSDARGRTLLTPRGDGQYYYAYLPSLWLDHDLDLRDEYKVTRNWYRLGDTPLGRPSNPFGVGPALFASPVFLAAHGVARITGARADGFSTLELGAVAWLSAFVSIMSIVFVARTAARRLGVEREAVVAAVCLFVGGPVIYYAINRLGTSHPFATLFVAWLVDAWDASYDRPRGWRTWAGLGALYGCALLARPQLAPWGLLLVAAALDDLRRAKGGWALARAAARHAAAIGLIALLFLPQLLAWRALYGEWYLVPQGPGFMRWDAPAWSETLFSARNGLLPWSPLYAVALVGMFVGLRRAPRLFGLLIACIAAQVVVNGAVYDWWGGSIFGGRRFDSTFIAFALGLTVVFAAIVRAWRAGRRGRAAAARFVAAIAGAVACLWLTASGVTLAIISDAINSHTKTGRSAAEAMRDKLGPFAAGPALASELSNLPARVWFAARYDTSLSAYDHLVGRHWLGETYPGLNSNMPELEETHGLMGLPKEAREGLRKAPGGGAELVTGRARILVGLNRRSGVELTIPASHPDGGTLSVRWNGRAHPPAPYGSSPTPIIIRADAVERGINVLEFDAAAGTRLEHVTIRALGPY